MINLLLVAAATAASAQTPPPAFRVQVSSFVALALRESSNDYAAYVTDPAGARVHAAAIAPTFATCAALPTDQDGFPVMMMCSSEYMPSANAAELYEEGAAAIEASLPGSADGNATPLSGSWATRGRTFKFFAFEPPNRPDLKALMLSSLSFRHLARSPLAASVKTLISKGLQGLPDDFDGMRDGTPAGIKEAFGAAIAQCRFDEALVPTLECLTPGYADPADAVFAAAKEAVAAALPPGFSAASCKKRYCDWTGPDKELVGLMGGVNRPGAYGVKISIARRL